MSLAVGSRSSSSMKRNYSRAEWSALTIQERIQAMNETLDDVEQKQQQHQHEEESFSVSSAAKTSHVVGGDQTQQSSSSHQHALYQQQPQHQQPQHGYSSSSRHNKATMPIAAVASNRDNSSPLGGEGAGGGGGRITPIKSQWPTTTSNWRQQQSHSLTPTPTLGYSQQHEPSSPHRARSPPLKLAEPQGFRSAPFLPSPFTPKSQQQGLSVTTTTKDDDSSSTASSVYHSQQQLKSAFIQSGGVAAAPSPNHNTLPSWASAAARNKSSTPTAGTFASTPRLPLPKRPLSATSPKLTVPFREESSELNIIPSAGDGNEGMASYLTPKASPQQQRHQQQQQQQPSPSSQVQDNRPKNIRDFWAQRGLQPISSTSSAPAVQQHAALVANPNYSNSHHHTPDGASQATKTGRCTSPSPSVASGTSSRVSVVDRWKRRSAGGSSGGGGDEEDRELLFLDDYGAPARPTSRYSEGPSSLSAVDEAHLSFLDRWKKKTSTTTLATTTKHSTATTTSSSRSGNVEAKASSSPSVAVATQSSLLDRWKNKSPPTPAASPLPQQNAGNRVEPSSPVPSVGQGSVVQRWQHQRSAPEQSPKKIVEQSKAEEEAEESSAKAVSSVLAHWKSKSATAAATTSAGVQKLQSNATNATTRLQLGHANLQTPSTGRVSVVNRWQQRSTVGTSTGAPQHIEQRPQEDLECVNEDISSSGFHFSSSSPLTTPVASGDRFLNEETIIPMKRQVQLTEPSNGKPRASVADRWLQCSPAIVDGKEPERKDAFSNTRITEDTDADHRRRSSSPTKRSSVVDRWNNQRRPDADLLPVDENPGGSLQREKQNGSINNRFPQTKSLNVVVPSNVNPPSMSSSSPDNQQQLAQQLLRKAQSPHPVATTPVYETGGMLPCYSVAEDEKSEKENTSKHFLGAQRQSHSRKAPKTHIATQPQTFHDSFSLPHSVTPVPTAKATSSSPNKDTNNMSSIVEGDSPRFQQSARSFHDEDPTIHEKEQLTRSREIPTSPNSSSDTTRMSVVERMNLFQQSTQSKNEQKTSACFIDSAGSGITPWSNQHCRDKSNSKVETTTPYSTTDVQARTAELPVDEPTEKDGSLQHRNEGRMPVSSSLLDKTTVRSLTSVSEKEPSRSDSAVLSPNEDQPLIPTTPSRSGRHTKVTDRWVNAAGSSSRSLIRSHPSPHASGAKDLWFAAAVAKRSGSATTEPQMMQRKEDSSIEEPINSNRSTTQGVALDSRQSDLAKLDDSVSIPDASRDGGLLAQTGILNVEDVVATNRSEINDADQSESQPFASPPAASWPDATARSPFSRENKHVQEEDEVGAEQLMATQQQIPNSNYPGVKEYVDTSSGKLPMPAASEHIIASNLLSVNDFVTIKSMEKEPNIDSENSGAGIKTRLRLVKRRNLGFTFSPFVSHSLSPTDVALTKAMPLTPQPRGENRADPLPSALRDRSTEQAESRPLDSDDSPAVRDSWTPSQPSPVERSGNVSSSGANERREITAIDEKSAKGKPVSPRPTPRKPWTVGTAKPSVNMCAGSVTTQDTATTSEETLPAPSSLSFGSNASAYRRNGLPGGNTTKWWSNRVPEDTSVSTMNSMGSQLLLHGQKTSESVVDPSGDAVSFTARGDHLHTLEETSKIPSIATFSSASSSTEAEGSSSSQLSLSYRTQSPTPAASPHLYSPSRNPSPKSEQTPPRPSASQKSSAPSTPQKGLNGHGTIGTTSPSPTISQQGPKSQRDSRSDVTPRRKTGITDSPIHPSPLFTPPRRESKSSVSGARAIPFLVTSISKSNDAKPLVPSPQCSPLGGSLRTALERIRPHADQCGGTKGILSRISTSPGSGKSPLCPSISNPVKSRSGPLDKHLLVLMSSQALSRDQVSIQQQVKTILKAQHMPYEEIDGAIKPNRERRNELFNISGIWAKYPQFFVVNGDRTWYWGNWETLQERNENGTLLESFIFPSSLRHQNEKSDSPAIPSILALHPRGTHVLPTEVGIGKSDHGIDYRDTKSMKENPQQPAMDMESSSHSGSSDLLNHVTSSASSGLDAWARTIDGEDSSHHPPSAPPRAKSLAQRHVARRIDDDSIASEASISVSHHSAPAESSPTSRRAMSQGRAPTTPTRLLTRQQLRSYARAGMTIAAVARKEGRGNSARKAERRHSGENGLHNVAAHKVFTTRRQSDHLESQTGGNFAVTPTSDGASTSLGGETDRPMSEGKISVSTNNKMSFRTTTAATKMASQRLVARKRELQAYRQQQKLASPKRAGSSDVYERDANRSIQNSDPTTHDENRKENCPSDQRPDASKDSRGPTVSEETPPTAGPSISTQCASLLMSQDRSYDVENASHFSNPTIGSELLEAHFSSLNSLVSGNFSARLASPLSCGGGGGGGTVDPPVELDLSYGGTTDPAVYVTSPLSDKDDGNNQANTYTPASGSDVQSEGRFSFGSTELRPSDVRSSSGLSRASSLATRAEMILKQRRKKSENHEAAHPTSHEKMTEKVETTPHNKPISGNYETYETYETNLSGNYETNHIPTSSRAETPQEAQAGATSLHQREFDELDAIVRQTPVSDVVDRTELLSRYQTTPRFAGNENDQPQAQARRPAVVSSAYMYGTSTADLIMMTPQDEMRPDAPGTLAGKASSGVQATSISSETATGSFTTSRLLDPSSESSFTRAENNTHYARIKQILRDKASEYAISPTHKVINEDDEDATYQTNRSEKQSTFSLSQVVAGFAGDVSSVLSFRGFQSHSVGRNDSHDKKPKNHGSNEQPDSVFMNSVCTDFMLFGPDEEEVAIEVEYMEDSMDDDDDDDDHVGLCSGSVRNSKQLQAQHSVDHSAFEPSSTCGDVKGCTSRNHNYQQVDQGKRKKKSKR